MYSKEVGNMPISIRLSPEEESVIRKFAEFQGLSVSELIRQSVLDRIEDELDLKEYEKAKSEYLADPVSYSLD